MLATMQNANAYQLQTGDNAEMLRGTDRVHGAHDLRTRGLGQRPSFLKRGRPAGTGIRSVPAGGWRETCCEIRMAERPGIVAARGHDSWAFRHADLATGFAPTASGDGSYARTRGPAAFQK